jgi:Holliday junction resolvase-like predicted endonuclease
MRRGAITRQSVLSTLAEYDELGRETFLAKYGYSKARTYVLVHEGRDYNAKAIAGVAHKWDHERALKSSEFSGGKAHAVTWLERLGFQVQGGALDFSELEFTHFLVELLAKTGHRNVSQDVLLGPGARADIIAESQDAVLIIEVKRVSPQTNLRIKDVVNQMKHYGGLARAAQYGDHRQRLVVAAPGILANKGTEPLTKSGIEIWDGPWIAQRSVAAGLQDEASKFLAPEYFEAAPQSEALDLIDKLTQMPAGRATWSAYQRLCRDIAEYLFCPPFKIPRMGEFGRCRNEPARLHPPQLCRRWLLEIHQR